MDDARVEDRRKKWEWQTIRLLLAALRNVVEYYCNKKNFLKIRMYEETNKQKYYLKILFKLLSRY